jgi:hypothetical protein
MNGKRKTIVIKLKNHKIKPDHRTDSPSQRGPGGVVTELVECVGCSFLIPHSQWVCWLFNFHSPMTNYLGNGENG